MGDRRRMLRKVAAGDDQYAVEAYEFLCQALTYTQCRSVRQIPAGQNPTQDVTVTELLDGIREFAREQYGMMAPTVLAAWGIKRTNDFGAIVARLFDAGLWFSSKSDRLEDFDNVFDFDQAFRREYSIPVDEI